MTLCAIWRDEGRIHMASDSCLTVGPGRTANIGIKVARERFVVRAADDPARQKPPAAAGDVAFCFAGMETGAVHMKEALAAILGNLRLRPGADEIRFEGIARLAFAAYKAVAGAMGAAIAQKGFSRVVVAGLCPAGGDYRAFCFSTRIDEADECAPVGHHMDEILARRRNVFFIGSAAAAARARARALARPPTTRDILAILQAAIDDPGQPSVAGRLQYGRFEGPDFRLMGVRETARDTHAWRGALDLGSAEFGRDFAIDYPLIPLEGFEP
ncbi:MAG TPA: hypothetical protein VFW19_07055 [Allosphingosinicella sp.]|nr:hypothetical protein [Allosphingosinicella sp.]